MSLLKGLCKKFSLLIVRARMIKFNLSYDQCLVKVITSQLLCILCSSDDPKLFL